jgi:RNA polymerase sigma-70 factor, ECF subfamily
MSSSLSNAAASSSSSSSSTGAVGGALRLASRPAARAGELPSFTEIPAAPPQSPDAQTLTVERVLTVHGAEIFGWMLASLSESDAADAFSLFSEDLWKSLSRYDGRCSMRTWCYMLARHAVSRIARAGRIGPVGADRAVPLSQVRVSHIAAELRERTVEHLRSDVKARVRSLREHLSADDQTLLVLRVDKDLAWRDISLVFLGAEASEADLTRHAAGLRKRFERIKAKLRALVTSGDEAGALQA